MNIESKMANVLNYVLEKTGYTVKIHNNNRWDILYDGAEILQIASTKDINSHWREAVKDEIGIIINERIKTALNEV